MDFTIIFLRNYDLFMVVRLVLLLLVLTMICTCSHTSSNLVSKRAANCQNCMPGEECLRGGCGEPKMCAIRCGLDRQNPRCPLGFYCADGDADICPFPSACVPIESSPQKITSWGRPLCVLTNNGYIFWTYGVLVNKPFTIKQQWKIAEGCTTDVDESYTAVCAPGTEPAPVVTLVSCETITTKRSREEIRNTKG